MASTAVKASGQMLLTAASGELCLLCSHCSTLHTMLLNTCMLHRASCHPTACSCTGDPAVRTLMLRQLRTLMVRLAALSCDLNACVLARIAAIEPLRSPPSAISACVASMDHSLSTVVHSCWAVHIITCYPDFSLY